jgi:outer membrane protein OmpA-like peptidoglycan-associated protein
LTLDPLSAINGPYRGTRHPFQANALTALALNSDSFSLPKRISMLKTMRSLLTTGVVLVIAFVIAGCGVPTVFSGQTGLSVAGDPPPLPPPPTPPPPPPPPKRVKIVDNKIVINEKVFFAFDKALIKDESHGLLDEVAKVMKDNAHVTKVTVEGHASLENDTAAARQYNKLLSSKRAEAVKAYLVAAGVGAGRLDHKGYGVEKPLASNDSDEGREKNRRVEFTITAQSPKAKGAK